MQFSQARRAGAPSQAGLSYETGCIGATAGPQVSKIKFFSGPIEPDLQCRQGTVHRGHQVPPDALKAWPQRLPCRPHRCLVSGTRPMSTSTPWASTWTSGWSSLAPSASSSWALVMTMGSKCPTPAAWVLAWHVGQPLTPGRGERRPMASLANPLLPLSQLGRRFHHVEGAVLASCVRVLRGGGHWGGVEVSGGPGWVALGTQWRAWLGGPGDTVKGLAGRPWGHSEVWGRSSGIGLGRPLLQGKGLPEGEGGEVGSPLWSCDIARTLAFPHPCFMVSQCSGGRPQPVSVCSCRHMSSIHVPFGSGPSSLCLTRSFPPSQP